VQISDENLHHVEVMDEVFGEENFVSLVTFAKTTDFSGAVIEPRRTVAGLPCPSPSAKSAA
jgi:hypothetical protein